MSNPETANRGYPIPVASNSLANDVLALIELVDKLDIDVQTLVAAAANIISSESPSFSGTPTVPTAAAGSKNQQIANTQFVDSAIAALVSAAPAQLDTINELSAALGNDPNFVSTITALIATKADQSEVDAMPKITSGTAPPDGSGNEGDIYIQYE